MPACPAVLALMLLALWPPAQAQSTGRQAVPRANAESTALTTSVRSQYVVHCAGCHGMDGAGTQAGNVPNMRRLGQFLLLDGGREYVIKVPGVMGSGLNDQQVADVTNWVLATLAPASVPEGHAPYNAAEVRRGRAQPLVDVAAARHALQAQAQARGVELD